MSAVAIHHVISGPADAPVVVLEGSLGATLDMWDPQAAALSEAFRLVRVDHRGHGLSPVPPGPYTIDDLGADLVAVLDALDVEQAGFAGLSIGGMVGMWLGIHAPERISRLALVCTSAYASPSSAWIERADLVRSEGTAAVVADAVVSRWFTPDWAAEHPDVVRTHRAMIADTDPYGYAACCEAIAAMDLRGDLGSITAPTLVISGSEDPALPPPHQRLIAGSIAGSRLVTLDHAAHLPNVQHPAVVNELLLEHFSD